MDIFDASDAFSIAKSAARCFSGVVVTGLEIGCAEVIYVGCNESNGDCRSKDE
jgi:hypothetical protein